MALEYTECPYVIQITINCTNIFHTKAHQNVSKFGFLVWKYTIWQDCFANIFSYLSVWVCKSWIIGQVFRAKAAFFQFVCCTFIASAPEGFGHPLRISVAAPFVNASRDKWPKLCHYFARTRQTKGLNWARPVLA
jgi:hypothetical protein